MLFLTMAQGPAFAAADALPTPAEDAFLKRHWPSTIPLQGEPPRTYSALEASLEPRDCGVCHRPQYQDWRTSRHSKAMGPGVLGQLVDMVGHDPATTRRCWSCHTPLAEQQSVVQDTNGRWQNNRHFDAGLQQQGLVCAGCHVRRHQRFGPPRRDDPGAPGPSGEDAPHNGFSAQTAFTRSAFCKGCHQFNPDDYALNGKLIENTYEEWKASEYASRGVQCQGCHMPDRRHLWRGIHDPDMVREAVDIDVELTARRYRRGDRLEAVIRLTNSGAGHHFPTYVTPKIQVQAWLADRHGRVHEDTLQEAFIGREVSVDMSRELYDTRIPAGESLAVEYTQTVPEDGMQLRVEITVHPDHFYTRFYESILTSGSADQGRRLLEQALVESRASVFTLFAKTLPLTVDAEIPSNRPAGAAATAGRAAPRDPHDDNPDWNAAAIDWLDYDSGLALAARTGKPMLLVLYADWCPTCHAYRTLFRVPEVIANTRDLVMVRVNIDRRPGLNRRYNLDGDYVPRIVALDTAGAPLSHLYTGRRFPVYFVPADEPQTVTMLMRRAAALRQ